MAFFDIKVVKGGYGVERRRAEDQTTASNRSATLKPGEVVKREGTGGNFVDIIATGDPEVGTDILAGVAASTSTDTSSADGEVLVQIIGAGTVLRGKATTATNIDTQSEIDALVGDYVAFDVDGSNNITIDEDETDDPNVHGLQIKEGDPVKGTLDVLVNVLATEQGSEVGQTRD